MKRLGHIFAVLAFAFALLAGAAGGAMAHGEARGTPVDHHGSHHPPAPLQQDHHKAALAVAATCCPAAEAPSRDAVAAPTMTALVSWAPRPAPTPDTRILAPEPPPPKPSL
ncbi:MAG TPA: hypothetical protein VD860_17430 [Azospirillum sp.]|nr:hypothetical protein [Azospirillum sp.]